MKHDLEFIAEAKEVTGNIYNLAADALEEYGHCKRRLMDGQGRMCLLGVLNFVMHGDAMISSNGSIAKIKSLAPLLLSGDSNVVDADGFNVAYFSPIRWNNAPERTQAEVVALLRKAAKVL